MNTTVPAPPDTVPQVTAEDLARWGQTIARWAPWVGAAAVAGAAAWGYYRHRPPLLERWRIAPDGTIRGPWLAQRRLAFALRPLVHLTTPTDPDQLASWTAAADARTERQYRRLRRVWDHARIVLGVDARLRDWQVFHDRRVLTLAVGDTPVDTTRMMRRMANLGVLGAHEDLGFQVVPINAAEVQITIMDAQPEPIEVPTRHVAHHTVTTTVNGETTAHVVSTPTDIMLVTGTRWRSMIEPTITWDDNDTQRISEDDAIMASDPLPDQVDPPATRDDDRTGPDRTWTGPVHIEPQPRHVRLLPAQMAVIRYLAVIPRSTERTSVIAMGLDRDESNMRRSLKRLAAIGLVTEVDAHGSGWWALTDLGRETVSLPTPDPATGRTTP